MLALASILAKGGKRFLRRTLKVTYPWPDVPLFGGRKPVRGSSGASPIIGKKWEWCYFLKSEFKPKPMTRSHTFSRASNQLHVFSWSFDCFNELFAWNKVLILRFWIENPLYQLDVNHRRELETLTGDATLAWRRRGLVVRPLDL